VNEIEHRRADCK